jgi:asparagine synthase (glutamine-hydrolysing)
MCGITGEIRFDGATPDSAAVARMTEAMAARGPDAAGLFAQANVAFGHRRLRIIDLSDRAQQPMVDPALGLAIVFNGCIYNYKELRRELEDLGYGFFSNGDTETILKAYHAWGPDCVERLSGMFAFAIWERDTRVVTLARDRLGIKPLYYAEDKGGLRFASTLPALLAGGGIDTRIDPAALNFYMSFHAVVPPPHTILQGVRKLPPATVLRIEPDGRRTQRRYWTVEHACEGADGALQAEEWQERILDALRTAVRRRLVSDVPVGVLLSGGLDSSLIVGLLREEGQDALETFSVGFETVGNERGDEFEYSDIVAEAFATRHHKIRVDSATRLLPALPACVAAMSEPMVSHDNIGFYLLSEAVSKQVKVVQSGQGADEVFGGYHWYPPMLDSKDPVRDYCRLFRDRDHDEYAAAVSPDLCGDDWAERFVAERFAEPGADRPIDKALRLDTTVMLVDDPVKRVDNMTMAWGLEARVPFLDHDLVELAARAPAEIKVGNGGKHVLKEAARKIIPSEVIDRPKGYFPVPALKYIRGDVLDMVQGVLGSQKARERGVFNRGYVDRLLDDPEAHLTPLRGSKLWQVALLELWMQTHGL